MTRLHSFQPFVKLMIWFDLNTSSIFAASTYISTMKSKEEWIQQVTTELLLSAIPDVKTIHMSYLFIHSISDRRGSCRKTGRWSSAQSWIPPSSPNSSAFTCLSRGGGLVWSIEFEEGGRQSCNRANRVQLGENKQGNWVRWKSATMKSHGVRDLTYLQVQNDDLITDMR